MLENETSVKGIILSVCPQGEFGKRISLLSDSQGKITVFAQGAAKPSSKLIGACRPYVCGKFLLSKGKAAWNLHGVEVIDSFEEIPLSPETAFLGSYFLELAAYFSEEGMTEEESKKRLNLIYVSLRALRDQALGRTVFPEELLRRIFELKLLVQEGTYTEMPGSGFEACLPYWRYVLKTPLSSLYAMNVWEKLLPEGVKALSEEGESFCSCVRGLKNRQIGRKFKSEELI